MSKINVNQGVDTIHLFLGFDFDRGVTWWYSGERFDKEYALVATRFDHYIEVNIDGDEVEFIHHIQEN